MHQSCKSFKKRHKNKRKTTANKKLYSLQKSNQVKEQIHVQRTCLICDIFTLSLLSSLPISQNGNLKTQMEVSTKNHNKETHLKFRLFLRYIPTISKKMKKKNFHT